MRRIIDRIRVAYWFWRLSDMSIVEAWEYSDAIVRDTDFYTAGESFDAREAVEIEMSYWDGE